MKKLLLLPILTFIASLSHAATYYVIPNGNDSSAGTSWATAKRTIQAAIDIAAANDTVTVTNGI